MKGQQQLQQQEEHQQEQQQQQEVKRWSVQQAVTVIVCSHPSFIYNSGPTHTIDSCICCSFDY